MQAEITREWVTYKQAEELSGLSRTTLWKLLSAGELQVHVAAVFALKDIVAAHRQLEAGGVMGKIVLDI